MEMATPEERKLEERRRRTERQREKRAADRVCGNCGQPADGGLIDWVGQAKPLQIAACRRCWALLKDEYVPYWKDMTHYGVRCPISIRRRCADCISHMRAEGTSGLGTAVRRAIDFFTGLMK